MSNGIRTRDLRDHNPALSDENTVIAESEDDCLRIACAEGEKDSDCVTPIENSENLSDSELHRIIDAWPRLPEHLRRAIESMVEPYVEDASETK